MGMKRIWSSLTPYDLTSLKSIESIWNQEVILRLSVLSLAAVAVTAIYDTSIFAYWIVGYLLYSICCRAVLAALPNQAGPKALVVAAGLVIVDSFLYGAVAYLCWAQGTTLFKIVALASMFAAMLNCVSGRAVEPLLAGTNGLVLALLLSCLPLFDLYLGGNPNEVMILFIVLGASTAYFLASLYHSLKAHEMRKRAMEMEVDRVKLQSLGQLTGGVAHDFNNLLTVIIGNLDLRQEMDNEEDREQLLDEVEIAARKASQLTNQLLVYSRKSALDPVRVAVEVPLERAERLLNRLLPASLRLVFDLPPNLPDIMVDVGKFETVIMNLILNARDAMPDGGMIRVTARVSTEIDRARDGAAPLLGAGRYMALSVLDQGVGIPPDMQKRVLEPYFTTKSVGKGSGLGLPMALGFAEQSGGALTLDSIEGEGTQVVLWFPVADDVSVQIPEEPPVDEAA